MVDSVTSTSGIGNTPSVNLNNNISQGQSPASNNTPKIKEFTKDGSIFNLISGKKNANKSGGPLESSYLKDNILGKNIDKSVEVLSGPRQLAPQKDDDFNPEEADLGNLGQYSLEQLQVIKADLEKKFDSSENPFEKIILKIKLSSVQAEIEARDKKDEGNDDDKNNGVDKKDDVDDDKDPHGTGAGKAEEGSEEAKAATITTKAMGQRNVSSVKTIDSANKNLKTIEQQTTKLIQNNAKEEEKDNENNQTLSEENEQLMDQIVGLQSQGQQSRSSSGSGGDDTSGSGEDESDGDDNDTPLNLQAKGQQSRSTSSSGGGNSSVNAQIQTIQTRIVTNNAAQAQTSVAAKKRNTQNNRALRTLTRTQRAISKDIKTTQQQIQEDTQENNGVLKTMTKIDDVANKVVTVSTAVEMTGQVLQKVPHTAAVGSAMVVAGVYGKTAGNYAKAAANVGKAACYAAEGNILGCVTSVASAAMSAATAVKSTQQLKQMGGMGNLANAAEDKAKEQVEDQAKGQVEGQVEDKLKDKVKDEIKKAGEDGINKAASDSLKKGVGNFLKDQVKGAQFMNMNISTTDALLNWGSSIQSAAAVFTPEQKQQQAVTTVAPRSARMPSRRFARKRIAGR